MRANAAQDWFADAASRRKRSPGNSVLSDPIAWLDDDHQRQLATCDVLEQLIRNPRHSAVGSDIETAYWCLGEALPLHIADEEEAILPLLARRCSPGDRLGEISAVLRDNHVTAAGRRHCRRTRTSDGRRIAGAAGPFLQRHDPALPVDPAAHHLGKQHLDPVGAAAPT